MHLESKRPSDPDTKARTHFAAHPLQPERGVAFVPPAAPAPPGSSSSSSSSSKGGSNKGGGSSTAGGTSSSFPSASYQGTCFGCV